MAAAALPLASSVASAATNPRNVPPQPGDLLVNLTGDRMDETITLDDLRVGEGPVLAYPKDPVSGIIRKSRLNVLVATRLEPDKIQEDTLPLSADGVVAYSAICTHEGCIVSRLTEELDLICDCHRSEFDAGDRGKVVVGPATRRLAILPLKIADGTLTVAGDFIGPLGPPNE